MKLSAVIIAYNEEDKIGMCLDSLSAIADEIIVVDSFSTDRTVEICESKGATVIKQKFLGYIEQKNFALQMANYEYVLSLDADEVLSEKLKQSILNIKENPTHDAYKFNRLTSFCGQWIKHGGWYPDTKLRLWKKELGSWAGTNPHDKVVLNENVKVGFLEGDLLHYSIDSIEQHLEQIQKFTTIAAKAMHEKGRQSSIGNIILNSVFKFIRDYIIRLGFLDGFYGYVVAKNSAYAKYLKYLKLYQLNRKAKQ
ncbi:MAG: glycosyltransferase family 2 protein [Chlorobiota bacterium]